MTPPATITYTVTVGDIFDERADAFVNPWNRNYVPRGLLLSSGVSGKLKKLTGPEPWKELARLGLLSAGAAVATGPGSYSHARMIIHVAGLNARWRATPETVRASTRNAALLALRTQAATMVMPLIGAGTGGLSPAAAELAIREGLDSLVDPFPTAAPALRVRVIVHPRAR